MKQTTQEAVLAEAGLWAAKRRAAAERAKRRKKDEKKKKQKKGNVQRHGRSLLGS